MYNEVARVHNYVLNRNRGRNGQPSPPKGLGDVGMSPHLILFALRQATSVVCLFFSFAGRIIFIGVRGL